MAETLPPAGPDDWDGVAARYHDWHPSLQPHVERQLEQRGYALGEAAVTGETQQQPFTDVLADMRRQAATTGRLQYDGLRRVLVRGTYDAATLNSVITAVSEYEDDNLDSREPAGDWYDDHYSELLSALEEVPQPLLRQAYHQGKGVLPDVIEENIASETDALAGANVLCSVYDVSNLLDLKLDPGPQHDDELVRSFLQTPQYYNAAVKQIEEMHEALRTIEYEADHYLRESCYEFFAAAGFSDAVTDDILLRTMPRMMHDNESGNLDADRVLHQLKTVGEHVTRFGTDTLERLHRTFGVTGFDYMTIRQVENMIGILDDDPETVQRLQTGDSCVVFVDSRGDYNGAMLSAAETFNTRSNRTVTFEVRQPSDPYRYLALLDARGINPATVVLAAHGEPGYIGFGMKRGTFAYENRGAGSTDTRIDLTDSAFIDVIANDFMQDSRGIDLPKDTVGRRRIILLSCMSDAVRSVRRGQHSVRESMAETVALAAGAPTLDVYAAKDSIAEESAGGGSIHFLAEVGKDEWVPAKISHLSLNTDGSVRRELLDTLQIEKDVK